MGEYKLLIIFRKQIGFLLAYYNSKIVIELPFLEIEIRLSKEAKGYNLFYKWRKI